MAEENKEEIVNEEVKEVVADEAPVQSEEKQDRPDINYQRELERKNAQIEKLRQEAEVRDRTSVQKRDQNDLSTWSDHELKAISKSNDASVLPYKDQADDILLERKVKSLREKERMQEKRALSEVELRTKFPDAVDPSSELSLKMEQVMYDYDLQKSPAGRLAAAKIAAAELGIGLSKSKAKERTAEADRVARVKGQMVDGDRSKPPVSDSPKKQEELIKKLNDPRASKEDVGVAMGQILKDKGLEFNKFFNR